MKGVQISFSDIMTDKDCNDIFAGPGVLLKSMRQYILASTSKVLQEYKSDLKNSALSILLEKLDLYEEETTSQLVKKYELQVKETLLQVLNNKKLKHSIYSKVDCSILLNKYKIKTEDDFDYIVSNNNDFKEELNDIVHKIIIEELSLAIKQTDYYKECKKRYQNVIIQRIKSFGMILLKFIAGKLTWNDIMKISMWIIDKIKELTTNNRVGTPALFILCKN